MMEEGAEQCRRLHVVVLEVEAGAEDAVEAAIGRLERVRVRFEGLRRLDSAGELRGVLGLSRRRRAGPPH